MDVNEVHEKLKDVPETIHSNIEMIELNSPIKLFSGSYILRNKKGELSVKGEIIFDWVATSGCHFLGTIRPDTQVSDNFSINHYRVQ